MDRQYPSELHWPIMTAGCASTIQSIFIIMSALIQHYEDRDRGMQETVYQSDLLEQV
ncbi:hypothetical protein [Bacillus sp. FJAT-44742]|uniref:hypothetical protein n=1 Tax=Bacillus sp. FJAT-44742 TaxID=2014005 RepID=UPI0018E26D1C|nr:hypothetical protein [Bacillus sp. FJAT-44742]